MRKSNKILLGGFVALVLITIGVHVTLYAKIKNGDLVVLRDGTDEQMERIVAGNIKHVLIKGMEECRIVTGDSAILEMNKNRNKNFRYRVAGDSLIVEAGLSDEDYATGRRIYVAATLHLPPVESITASYSNVFLSGVSDTSAAISRNINLSHCQLHLRNNSRDGKPAFWKDLAINSRSSALHFAGGAVLNELVLTMNDNSVLTDEGAMVSNFQLQMDGSSSVNLHGAMLDKLKLIK